MSNDCTAQRSRVSGNKETSRHLLDVVSSSHRGSVPPNKCRPRQHVQVVVLWRVSGTLEHVQHLLGDQETTCVSTHTHTRFHTTGQKLIFTIYFMTVFERAIKVRPAMLMEETKAAASARPSGRLDGVRPPPISTRPPTAVRPAGEVRRKSRHQNGPPDILATSVFRNRLPT